MTACLTRISWDLLVWVTFCVIGAAVCALGAIYVVADITHRVVNRWWAPTLLAKYVFQYVFDKVGREAAKERVRNRRPLEDDVV